jgi:hypothetical protein
VVGRPFSLVVNVLVVDLVSTVCALSSSNALFVQMLLTQSGCTLGGAAQITMRGRTTSKTPDGASRISYHYSKRYERVLIWLLAQYSLP